MKVGSLFSGVGCGDLGLEWAGFEHSWFCEVNEYARKVLALRWPDTPIYDDITAVDFTAVEPVDLLAGGFPCQDISVAGKGAGIKGERSGLWSEFARAIDEIRPGYALIENSPALVNRGLDVVLSDLAALGYDAEWHCIPASGFGAPHERDRVWIVAYAQGEGLAVAARRERCWREKRLPGLKCRCLFSGGEAKNWAVEPRLGRMVDGYPGRVDRIRGIGNGQVPHCTYFIGRLIQNHAKYLNSKSVGK